MKKTTAFILALVAILSLTTGVLADEPTGDVAVVQAAANAYFESGKKPVTSADALFETLNDGDDSNDPFIVSVRAPGAYALGHIPGAINIPWKAIAEADNLAKLPTDKQIVVYCYTGHTGQIATTVLNLLGYDAINLKFGMMGWTLNDEVLGTGRYDPATSPDYALETEANEATETYAYPELSTGGADDFEIVRLAADNYLKNAPSPIIKADGVFENINDGDDSNDYVIVSVRAPEAYALGHVPGAVNIGWKAVAQAENMAKLPTDKPIAIYCYTGHTGMVSSTVLGMMGYETHNMKFGMMGWTLNDEVLGTARYDPATAPDYGTEAEAPAALPTTGGFFLIPSMVALGAASVAAGAAAMYASRRRED